MKPELLFDAKAYLGEGPIWDAHTQTLYWVDIFAKRIYAGVEVLIELDGYVGCIAPRKAGGFVFTQRYSFWTLDHTPGQPDSVRTTLVLNLDHEPVNNRFNDGKCDPRGRFIAGTMNLNETAPTGSLYSFGG